jgi:protein TonB
MAIVKNNSRPTDINPACSGLRTFLVPPDIVPVKRQSPVRMKKRTPWLPQPDGQQATERAGQREWFGDHVFVESHAPHARTGYGTSITMHMCCGAALIGIVFAAPVAPRIQSPRTHLVMPAMVAPVPDIVFAAPRSSGMTTGVASTKPPAAAPAPARRADADPSPNAAPVEAPSAILPESGLENLAPAGIEGGVPGGVPGGVAGGVLDGAPPMPGPPGDTPIRVGRDVRAPRKIKHVDPVYPNSALTGGAHGTVIIEATIGPDGKVQDLRLLRAVPAFNQSALDAVRQWEYEPTVVNGVRVSVVMTVLVTFSLQ